MQAPDRLQYLGRRSPVLGLHAAVATSQPLASEIGIRILKQGGNAVDAAVAISAALNVTEPCSTGLGGDCFMLYYEDATKKVHGMNGSGAAPAGLTLERAKQDVGADAESIPLDHAHTVTVPGAAAGWVDAVSKFGSGKLTLAQLLEPAAQLAEEGFPVGPVTAGLWAAGVWQLQGENGGELLMPDGTAPKAGQVFRNPTLARTLRELGAGGAAAFYTGRIGQQIVETVQRNGGVLTMEDLAEHRTDFPEPISVEYKGVRVHEVPPNGQGITALLALNIIKHAKQLELNHAARHTAAYLHGLIEAMRLAFADTRWYCADTRHVEVPIDALLGDEYAATRAALIDPQRASADVEHGCPTKVSCTVSFQVVDTSGNAVSFVNSNYLGFGTGLVPKGCGFSLQCRGGNFSLKEGHPNVLAPRKRPYHTIIPGMVTREDTGELYMTFSNMGGFMQPQGHMQLVVNMLDNGMDPQTAIDAARFCVMNHGSGGEILVEDGVTPETVAELRQMGHNVRRCEPHDRCDFGRAQIIYKDTASGVLWAGSDGRADGCAIAW